MTFDFDRKRLKNFDSKKTKIRIFSGIRQYERKTKFVYTAFVQLLERFGGIHKIRNSQQNDSKMSDILYI